MRALFLDRDGVINHDYGHVHTWEKFDFINGSLDALYALSKLKIKIIIVTNQAGIAKGYYTENLLQKLHKKLDDFFIANPSIEEVSNSGILLLTVSGFDSVLPIESFKKIFSVDIENSCSNNTFKALETFIFLIFHFFCSHQFSHLFFLKEIYL